MCFHWLSVWCQTHSPFFTQQASASVPVVSDTVCSLQYIVKFVLHKATRTSLDLGLTSNYHWVQKTNLFFQILSLSAMLECICGLDICFGFPTIQRHLFGFCLFVRKPFHWALTGGDIPQEAITVLSISQLLLSSVYDGTALGTAGTNKSKLWEQSRWNRTVKGTSLYHLPKMGFAVWNIAQV